MEKLKSFWNKIVTFAFRRTKRFYIILIVISSIVLLADLSIRLLVPDMSRFTNFSQTVTSFDSSDTTLPDSASGDADFGSDTDFDFDSGGSMPDMSDMQDSSGTFEQQSMTETSEESSTDGSDASGSNGAASEGTSAGSDAGDGSGAADGAAGGMQGGTDMQGGFASGDAASMPDMSGGFDMTAPDGNSQSTASGDTSESTEDDTSEVSNTFSLGLPLRILMGIRAAFWPIFLIAALIDGLSIAMLVLIRRREKKAEEEAEKERIAEAFASDGEVHLARPAAKKQKTSPVTWILIIIAIIVLLSIVRILSAATGEEASETEATVYEEAVESGDISTVLPGTGTLTEEDADEISLPSEVEITEWYVSNGDAVEEGDVLAAVDTNSALSAIASVQEVITSLDEALTELEEDTDTDAEVTAAAAGRVKAVYAEADANVIDTIYESGALLLLSLDGKMAVSFETESEATVGDSVTVTLSDGSEEDGTVESAVDGTVVVTLTDEDTDYGDSVTVTDADGNELGSGELYIHSELKVYAFSGTVDSVSVDVEDEVDAGDTLLSLTDVDNTFETALLVEQRSTLEEQIATLFGLYETGYLYADTAGVVSGISDSSDTSSDSSDSADSSDESSSDSTDSTESTESTDDTEASETGGSVSAAGIIQTAYAAGASYSAVTLTASADDTDDASVEQVTDDTEDDSDSTDTDDTDTDTTDSDGTDSDDTDSDDTDSDSGSSDDEESEDSSGSESSYTNYMALVTAVSGSTATAELYALSGSDLGTATTAEISLSGTIYVSADGTITDGSASDVEVGDTLILICSADDTAETLTPVLIIVAQSAVSEDSDSQSSDSDSSDGSGTQSDDAQTGSGSTDQGTQQGTDDATAQQDGTAAYGDSSALTDASDASALTSGTDTSALTSGTDTSALADTTDADAAAAVTETLTEEVTTTYSVDETTLLSITPQDYVYVTITVDELDILSLKTGLTAEVTLDAFPGQSFTGVVDSIDTSGTNAGGNSKYTAVVKIERTEDMLSGMNASVKITLDTTEDVLYVPADAIVEDEDGTYVYTSYDEKTDTLGDPVEVETGVSDGTNVEIVSGLSEGDTYYYSVLDTVNYSTSTSSSAAGGFSFSFGGGGGMGGGF